MKAIKQIIGIHFKIIDKILLLKKSNELTTK